MSEDRVQVLDEALVERLLARARTLPRLRTNHNFHSSMEENPHRFLNVMVRGTYIAPHRHLEPPKSESFLVLRGEVAFFVFDEDGEITRVEVLGRGKMGIDIGPGIWHTLAVLSAEAVCYEVKPGPYLASNDKDFAGWAPREGAAGAAEYLERLVASVKGRA